MWRQGWLVLAPFAVWCRLINEVGATIYDNALLRKWVLGASLATASFVEIAGKSALGRRGEGDLARVACGMK